MPETPVDFTKALAYARGQRDHLNPPAVYGISSWYERCQQFVHTCYGLLGGGFGSAYAQWLGTSPENRHVGGNPDNAPVGALLFSKNMAPGGNPAGHVWLAAYPFKNGTGGSFSNDMEPGRPGTIMKVPRTAPMTNWGHTFLGWGFEINGYDLDLTHTRPKPPQTKRYDNIGRAILRLQGALATAERQKDHADVRLLTEEIHRLQKMHATMRRA